MKEFARKETVIILTILFEFSLTAGLSVAASRLVSITDLNLGLTPQAMCLSRLRRSHNRSTFAELLPRCLPKNRGWGADH